MGSVGSRFQKQGISAVCFGDCRNSTGNVTTDKLFTGQRLDQTGLYFYNARYYDATIGRFISPDSIVPDPFNPQSWNRYSYVFNNPLICGDPTGHWPPIVDNAIKSVTDAVGDTVGAVCDGVEAAVDATVDASEWVGEKAVDSVVWVGDKITDGAEWAVGSAETALGIGNIDLITVDSYLGIPYLVPVITAQDSGLNLVKGTLDTFGADAMAVGVILLDEQAAMDPTLLAHEKQHIKEQMTFGVLPWLTGYIAEYSAGVAWYGASHSHDVYENLSFEKRARDAAGQPDPPNQLPEWHDPWFEPWIDPLTIFLTL